jgi:hypothetical protein
MKASHLAAVISEWRTILRTGTGSWLMGMPLLLTFGCDPGGSLKTTENTQEGLTLS